MQTSEPDALSVKIELIRGTIMQVESYAPDSGADRLVSILEAYEYALLRQKFRMETDFDELAAMKQAVRDSGCLLVDLNTNEAGLMAGWYHGITPTNPALALANLLSRIIIELSGIIFILESQFPELKEVFDSERRWHAKLIQDAEDKKEHYG